MINKLSKNYKFINDTIYTFLSASLPLILIQFFLFPSLSLNFPSEEYGLIISLYSIISFTGVNLGSAINNSRLVNDNKLRKLNSFYDYNLILFTVLVLNVIFTITLLVFFSENLGIFDYFIVILLSCLTLLINYLQVIFRLELKFNLLFSNSIFYLIGLAFGYFIYLISNYWLFIFFFGALTSFFFLIFVTKYNFLRISELNNFSFFFKETIFHIISTILVSIGIYVDKIILFPILGGNSVSIYYVSSLLGKSFYLIIGPISGVFLTYLSKLNRFSRNNFYLLVIITLSISTLSYFAIIIFSKPILSILYPNLYLDSMIYVWLSSLSQLIFIAGSILNPIIIRFNKAKLQFYLNFVYSILYIGLGIPMIFYNGLMGFILSTLIINLIRLIYITLYIYYNNFEEKNNNYVT